MKATIGNLLVCVSLAVGAFIVVGPPGTAMAQNDPGVQQKRAKVRERIRALRAWKLTEELQLDQVTASKLFPILNRYDEKFEALVAESQKVRREIRTVLASGASTPQTDKQLETLIDQMAAQQEKWWDLERDRFREVRKVLAPRQAARIFVILPAIDRKIQRQIGRALRGKGDKARGRPDRKTRRQGKATGAEPTGAEPDELLDDE